MYIEMYFIESYSISQLRGKNRAHVRGVFYSSSSFRLARPVGLHNRNPSRRHSRIRFVAPVCCCSRIHRSRIRHSRNRPPVVSVGSRIQVPFHSRNPHSRNRFVPAHSRSRPSLGSRIRRNKNPFLLRFVVLDLKVPM